MSGLTLKDQPTEFTTLMEKKEEHHRVMSLDAEKHLTSFLSLFTIETLSKAGREENFLNLTRTFRNTLQLPSHRAGKAQEQGKDPPPPPHTCTQCRTGGVQARGRSGRKGHTALVTEDTVIYVIKVLRPL